jgi:TRAP-type mannitol/chloroaromatic compound transport system permease large subunit
MLGLSMLGLIVIAIMLGYSTAFTLLGLGFLYGFLYFMQSGAPWGANPVFDLMVERAFSTLNNETLVSVPLFVLMGYIVERTALVDRMFDAVQLAFRRLPASLAVTTLLVCTFWGIASGIVGAVVVVMGVIALGPMMKAGYDVRLATGVIAAGGTLGILIPPSVLLIVYGAVAGQSVVKLYAAAMFPGFFLSALYLAYIVAWALIDPKVAPKLDPGRYAVTVPSSYTAAQRAGNALAASMPLALTAGGFALAWWYFMVRNAPGAAGAPEQGLAPEFVLWFWGLAAAAALALYGYYRRLDAEQLEILKKLLISFVPLTLLTLAVLGSILLGIATPTESAAVGVIGALAIAAAMRQLTWVKLRESVFLSARTSAMVCWLFVGSAIFSSAFALHGGQALIERWVLGMELSPLQFMLLAQAIIFLLGWPLEWTEIIVIFVPIFLPMLKHFGIDPILFGVMVAVNLQAAFLSPPVAMSAFYLKGVAPAHVTLNQIFGGMFPYMLIVLLCMAIMYVFPGLTLWLPNLLYGR